MNKDAILAWARADHAIDDNGDPVGASPDVGWETGYSAGLRCFYRTLKAMLDDAAQPIPSTPIGSLSMPASAAEVAHYVERGNSA